jgi:hypothetical protein
MIGLGSVIISAIHFVAIKVQYNSKAVGKPIAYV